MKDDLTIDVFFDRVGEITSWFQERGLMEQDVVEQSGWLFTATHYRVAFYRDQREIAMLFKLTFG